MGYDIDKIRSECEFIRHVEYVPECDSTNQLARKLAFDGAEEGELVLTDIQTCGRGRLGRSWCNCGKDAIAMSLVLRPQLPPESVSMITLAAAVSAADAFTENTGITFQIKWPNDILYNNRKVCGILTEGVIQGMDISAVLGIGINVNSEEFPEEISDIASSLKLCCNRECNREDIIVSLIRSFGENYRKLHEDKSLVSMLDSYNSRSIFPEGIDEYGRLKIRDDDGNIVLINSGEVS